MSIALVTRHMGQQHAKLLETTAVLVNWHVAPTSQTVGNHRSRWNNVAVASRARTTMHAGNSVQGSLGMDASFRTSRDLL